ncbi:MAG: hypothetical protein ABSA97_10715 [Verrucomicrobiia bacterium]
MELQEIINEGQMKLSAVVLACSFLLISHAFADLLTLNSGEVIRGEIVSETDTQIVLQISNYNRTIITRQLILKSDIKTIERESAQQKQEWRAYEALDRIQLDPNCEFSKAGYESGIEAFNRYLATYPNSRFVADVRQRLSLWTNDLSHVEHGEVKLNNSWMTPDEKRVQVASTMIVNLRKRLRDLQKRHNEVVKAISDTEAAIKLSQDTIRHPPERWNDGHFVWHHGALYPAGDGHPETDIGALNKAKQDLIADQNQLGKLNKSLNIIENEIDATSRQLAEAEATYKAVYTKPQEPLPSLPVPVHEATPTP